MDLAGLVPREHGTWAMLLVPWVIGVGVARRVDAPGLLLLVALLALFLAQAQLLTWARLRLSPASSPQATSRALRRAVALGAAGALAAAPLVLAYQLTALIPLGVVAAASAGASIVLVRRRVDRALPGQVLGAAGLSLSAAAAHVVATGALTVVAVQLWAISALFFLGSVLYVGTKIEALRLKSGPTAAAARRRLALRMLVLDGVIITAVAVALLPGTLPPRVLLAFAPTAAQSAIGAARLHRPARLKRVGVLAAVHSVTFAVLAIVLA